MAQSVIDLTSDDEDLNVSQSWIIGDQMQVQHAVVPDKIISSYVIESHSNIGTIRRYKDVDSQTVMPTIVNIQSLAPSPNLSSSSRKSSILHDISEKSAINESEAHTPVLNKHVTYFNTTMGKIINQPCGAPRKKRKISEVKGPISTIESIEASIERCVRGSVDDEPSIDETLPSKSVVECVRGSNDNETPSLDYFSPFYCGELLAMRSDSEARDDINSKVKNVIDSQSHKINDSNRLLFEEFLNKCAYLEDVEADRIRAAAKLKSYHEKASTSYVTSQHFKNILKRQLQQMNKERLYICVKEVLDELKLNKVSRRVLLMQSNSKDSNIIEISEPNETGDWVQSEALLELSAEDKKNVKKLEKILTKINKRIKVLEETEVDLNDEEDSAYFRMHRYRERAAKIHKKICEITGSPIHAGRVVKKKIRFKATPYPEANAIIERWLNKTGLFPDFSDVVKMFQNLNLNISPEDLRTLAAEAFRDIGKQLQYRRRLDLWDSLQDYIADDNDPARFDPLLQATLDKNKAFYEQKEKEIIDKFVEKQMEAKEEPAEVSDEAKSDGDDDDDNDNDDNDDEEEEEEKEKEEGKEYEHNNKDIDILIVSSSDSEHESKSDADSISTHSTASNLPTISIHDETSAESKSVVEDTMVIVDELSRGSVLSSENQSSQIKINEAIEVRRNRNRINSKPFGSVGTVIEIDYAQMHHLIPDDFKFRLASRDSILKDRCNIERNENVLSKPRLKSEMRRGIRGFKKSIELSKFKSRKEADEKVCLLRVALKNLLKNHGTVVNDVPGSERASDDGDVRQGKPERGSESSQGGAGGGENGDDGNGDQDGDRRRNLKDGGCDKPDDNDETEEEGENSRDLGGQDSTSEIQEELNENVLIDRESSSNMLGQAEERVIGAVDEYSRQRESKIDNEIIQDNWNGREKCLNLIGDDIDTERKEDSLWNEEESYLDNREVSNNNKEAASNEKSKGSKVVRNERGDNVKRRGNNSTYNDNTELFYEPAVGSKVGISAGKVEDEAIFSKKQNLENNPDNSVLLQDPESHNYDLDEAKMDQGCMNKEKQTEESRRDDNPDEDVISSNIDVPNQNDQGDSKMGSEASDPNADEEKNSKHKKPAWIDNGEDTESDSSPDEAVIKEPSVVFLKTEDKKQTEPTDKPEGETSNDGTPDAIEAKRKGYILNKDATPKKLRSLTPKSDVSDIEVISENIVTRPVTPDERVKRFLQNAGKSLAITVTRKKAMSREAQEALQRLKGLKNISATRVARTEPEILVVDERGVAGPSNQLTAVRQNVRSRTPIQRAITHNQALANRNRNPSQCNAFHHNTSFPVTDNRPTITPPRRNGLPFISSVQSLPPRTPVITGVRGGPALRGGIQRSRGFPLPRRGTSAMRPRVPAPSQRGRGQAKCVPFVVLD